jgi:hypothetical protein
MTTMEPWVPTFVGGFRSGSTLLINLLGMHPHVAPWFETKAFCEALRWIRVLSAPEHAAFESKLAERLGNGGFDAMAVAERMRRDVRETAFRLERTMPSGKAAYERYPIGFDWIGYPLSEAEAAVERWLAAASVHPSADRVARATERLIGSLGDLHARHAQRPYWINKTPEIVRFGGQLEQCLGPCRRILLVRNGYDVVASAHRLQWAAIPELARWWRLLIELSRAGGAPTRYLEVRFEDLIHNPVPTLNRILVFLGLYDCGELLVREFLRRLGQDAFTWPGDRSPPKLSIQERNAIEREAGALLRELDYHRNQTDG